MCGPFADQIGHRLLAIIRPANDRGEGKEEQGDRDDPFAIGQGCAIGAGCDARGLRVGLIDIAHVIQHRRIGSGREGFLEICLLFLWRRANRQVVGQVQSACAACGQE